MKSVEFNHCAVFLKCIESSEWLPHPRSALIEVQEVKKLKAVDFFIQEIITPAFQVLSCNCS